MLTKNTINIIYGTKLTWYETGCHLILTINCFLLINYIPF